MTVFSLDGDILTGCGIMVMDTEMYGAGDIIITGQDHFHTMAVCIVHLILSGDIMIHFTDMDTDMHTDMDIHIGDLTTHGIMITITVGDGIRLYHS